MGTTYMTTKKEQIYYNALGKFTKRQEAALFPRQTLAKVAMNELNRHQDAAAANLYWEVALNLNFISLQ
jgi:hypothetical protein